MTNRVGGRIALALLVGLPLTGCAKKLVAPTAEVPQATAVAYQTEAPTAVPTVAPPTPAAPAATPPCEEAMKVLQQAKEDIAAAVDVTPDLVEAQALLDVAKKLASDAEAAIAAKKCAEAIPMGKDSSAKAKEAEELARRMKKEMQDADCQTAEARIKQAEADVAAAHAAGAEAWAAKLMEQADAALLQAKTMFLVKKCVEASGSATDASAKAKAALAAKPAPKAESRYKVVKGDCLWDIAGKRDLLSDSWVWPLVYQANRDQITDPNLIFPGQLFLIPKDSSPERVKEAVSQAQAAPWPKK